MKISIKRFKFYLPSRLIAFVFKIALYKQKEEMGLTKKEIKKLVNQARKEIIRFKKHNGKFVLVEVIEKDGETFKLTI